MKFSSTYLDWLKSEITEEDLGNGYTEITAPFLDRHNDYIQIIYKPLKKACTEYLMICIQSLT